MAAMGWTRRGALAALGAWAIVLGFPITASAERVVYVNLEPTTLIDTAGQDPTMNSYSTGGFTPGPISGWPELTDEQRAELLYWLHEATVPFDITFTLDRPAAGTYDMIVTGTEPDAAALFSETGCSVSIGLADCSDMNAENISFLFYGCLSDAQQQDMRPVAFYTLVALGFGWGLENLSGSGQVMAGYSVFGLEFGDECTTILESQCEHMGCPEGQQNSTADLTSVVGARVDDGPPVVTILSPDNLTVVDSEVEFVVEAEITDKFGGLSASLEIVEEKFVHPLDDPPFEWNVQLPPTRESWTLRVSGTDADGNVTTEEVVVCVDVDQCDIGSGSEGSSGSTGDAPTTGLDTGFATDIFDDTTGTSSGGGEGESGPINPTTPIDTGFDLGPASSGCHCRSGDPSWSALLLLVLLGLRRSTLRPRG
jgi:hypothetical protein